jgi:uncharacterized membrane protein
MENLATLHRPPANTRATHGLPTARAAVDWIPLGAVYAVSVASLVGFVVFTRHPHLLNEIPGAAAVYGQMFVLAPRAQIVLAFASLVLFLGRHAGIRWLSAFAALYALSLSSELAGTTIGLPFGPYRYTDGLGVKLFGHVPALIPASWFFMAIPSYALARWRFPDRARAGRRVLLGSLVLLTWDLALDPAMSLVTKYWVWATEGPYYGMPLLNLVGWYTTGLALMAALVALRADEWVRSLSVPWLVAFYGANLLLPLGMSMSAGLWGAVAATVGSGAICWLLFTTRARGVV